MNIIPDILVYILKKSIDRFVFTQIYLYSLLQIKIDCSKCIPFLYCPFQQIFFKHLKKLHDNDQYNNHEYKPCPCVRINSKLGILLHEKSHPVLCTIHLRIYKHYKSTAKRINKSRNNGWAGRWKNYFCQFFNSM